MLRNSFIIFRGITPKEESILWENGFRSWKDLIEKSENDVFKNPDEVSKMISKYEKEAKNSNVEFFNNLLTDSNRYRLIKEFLGDVLYLDIETTGLSRYKDDITTITTYSDRDGVQCFIKDKNFDEFVEFVNKYKIMVTFNGLNFDVPFIENYFKIKLNHIQLDLRNILKELGYKGGLKKIEKELGISRDESDGLDGKSAIYIWKDYESTQDERYLETLLAYNVEDSVNLKKLLFIAYNKFIEATPFKEEKLIFTDVVENPYKSYDEITRPYIEAKNGY